MFGEIFFFTYIFAGFVGLLAILLVALLSKYWTSGNKQLLSAVRNFMICTAVMDGLYFYMNYLFLKTGIYTTQPALRVLDSFTFIGQAYFWCAYIREKCQLPQPRRKRMTLVTLCLCAGCLLTNLASYGFLMNDYYFVSAGPPRMLAAVIEVLLCVSLTFITVWHLLRALDELVQKKIRTFVTILSILIIGDNLLNSFNALQLITGASPPSSHFPLDFTVVFIFLINVFTVLLIYQEDFRALFHMTVDFSVENVESDIESRLDFIAQSHGLTLREREVLELAYEGLTNPEIAEELIISKYTVKRHMHNIFEKLDISTRMELVHLVGPGNGPGGRL
jgi:DNA-binding CsgD family transcriptional regulator